MLEQPPVCDYEGSDYRARFWENAPRDYEDRVERVALRRLMPPSGPRLIDIGAGFGRLAEEYRGYETVVLFDYSRSLLREAQKRLAHDKRYLFVAGNWYQMPFVDGLFETLVQVRTIHHAANVSGLFDELARIARPNANYVLEFASKQHIKSIIRYGLRRQDWSPFEEQPVEFAELNFDFHPRWIREKLSAAAFAPGRQLTVSHFRIPVLKQLLPLDLLVKMDSVAQWSGNWWQLSPSVFVRSRWTGTGATAGAQSFFACPNCRQSLPAPQDNRLICGGCGYVWAINDGLYDFKEPVQTPAIT